MEKVLGLVRGATVDEIVAACGPLIGDRAGEAGVRGFVVSEVVDVMVPGLDASAFVETWWDDARGRTARGGIDATWWRTTEHVYKARRYDDRAAERIKVIGTAYRRDDFDTRAFFDYWRDVHGPISGRAPGLGAYVVSEVLERLAGDLTADGFVEQWWPDRRTLDRAAASPEVAIAWEDVQKYAKPIGTFWVTREHVVLAPPADAPGTLER